MPRDKFVSQYKSTIGLYSTMSRPWEPTEGDVRGETVEPAEEPPSASAKPLFTWLIASLAIWMAAIKSILPDGMA
jgi:hypothetical protein